jgi:hypothetical protein
VTAQELAQALAAYDRPLAEKLVRAIAAELGGSPTWEPLRLRQFFRDGAARQPDRARETAEWKSDFARVERMRALGAELAQLVVEA